MFFLRSMGSHSYLMDSGNLDFKIVDSKRNNILDPEYKITFNDRSLESNIMSRYRKHMEIMI